MIGELAREEWCRGASTLHLPVHPDHAQQLADSAQHAYSQVVAAEGAGYALLRKGEFDRAVRALECGMAVCPATEMPYMTPVVMALLALSYCFVQRAEEGIPLLERALSDAQATGVMIVR